jgi:hypothetical protein
VSANELALDCALGYANERAHHGALGYANERAHHGALWNAYVITDFNAHTCTYIGTFNERPDH